MEMEVLMPSIESKQPDKYLNIHFLISWLLLMIETSLEIQCFSLVSKKSWKSSLKDALIFQGIFKPSMLNSLYNLCNLKNKKNQVGGATLVVYNFLPKQPLNYIFIYKKILFWKHIVAKYWIFKEWNYFGNA